MRLPLRLAALLLTLTMVLAACGGGGSTSTPTPSPAPEATATPPLATQPAETADATDLPQQAPTSTPPAPAAAATVVRGGDPSRRVVTLTFDAGSDTGFTAQILDTLADNSITAAFGITGSWAQRNHDFVRRIADDGHTFINHSFDHASFTGLSTSSAPLSQELRWYQLDRTESIINDLAGATTKPYFRPPYGDYNDSVNEDVFARGYRYNVMWVVDSGGWRGISAGEIVQVCLDGTEPGAILIFHVGSASQDANALQRVIDGLRDQDYGFVSLPELIGS